MTLQFLDARRNFLILVLNAGYALAQNPISEVSTWPTGAATLLGGLYLAARYFNRNAFDIIPSIVFAHIFLESSFTKRIVRRYPRLGVLVNAVVLESTTTLDENCPSLRHEWDVVVLTNVVEKAGGKKGTWQSNRRTETAFFNGNMSKRGSDESEESTPDSNTDTAVPTSPTSSNGDPATPGSPLSQRSSTRLGRIKEGVMGEDGYFGRTRTWSIDKKHALERRNTLAQQVHPLISLRHHEDQDAAVMTINFSSIPDSKARSRMRFYAKGINKHKLDSTLTLWEQAFRPNEEDVGSKLNRFIKYSKRNINFWEGKFGKPMIFMHKIVTWQHKKAAGLLRWITFKSSEASATFAIAEKHVSWPRPIMIRTYRAVRNWYLKDYERNPNAIRLLRNWSGLAAFQNNPIATTWDNTADTSEGDEAFDRVALLKSFFDHWVRKFENEKTVEPFPAKEEKYLQKQTMRLFFNQSRSEEVESIARSGMTYQSLSARDLAIMLAYVHHTSLPEARPDQLSVYKSKDPFAWVPRLEINPMLPLIYLWKNGRLSPGDNLHLTLPDAADITLIEKGLLAKDHNNSPWADEQEWEFWHDFHLSAHDYEIDGLDHFVFPRAPWFITIGIALVMTFFIMVATTILPSLAVSFALAFSLPYSNDYSWRDSGSPPSWNGRARVRWGYKLTRRNYSCGIFSGHLRPRMGPTGTSYRRAGILLIFAWLCWRYRPFLRSLLDFEPETPPAKWIAILALVQLGVILLGGLILLTRSLYLFYSKHLRTHAIFTGIFAVGLTPVITALVLKMMGRISGTTLIIVGEVTNVVVGSIPPAVVCTGQRYANLAMGMYVICIWGLGLSVSAIAADVR